MDKDEDGPERTCIVTRRTAAPESMIRFVIGPDACVVPDIRRRLPGRGVWVTASEQMVADAVKRQSFSRAFKAKVQTDPALACAVGDLLAADALQSLAMANKAGALTTGFAKVEAALAGGQVGVLLHAAEGAEDGIRKLDAVRHRHQKHADETPIVKLFSVEQLDLASGRTNVIHAALAAGPAAHAFLTRCRRLMRYRSAVAHGTGTDAETALV